MKRLLNLVLIATAMLPALQAQVIETVPGIPTLGQEITIYFYSDRLDPAASLYNYEGDLYAHTGVTIEGLGRWQNVIESWGNNTTQPKFEYMGSYRYRLVITPDIEHFYPGSGGVPIPDGTVVTEICLVIRNAAATAQTSPDIFINIFEAGLEVSITNPDSRSVVAGLNENIDINVSAAFADSVTLFIDNNRILKGDTPDALNYTFSAASYGGYWVKAVAYSLPETAVDSLYIFVPGLPTVADLPAGAEDGINYIDDNTVTLVLTAPGKGSAFAVGDFNNWLMSADSYMNVTPDGQKFWITIDGLTPSVEYRYQYLADDIAVADPYAEKILDPWNDGWIDQITYPGLIDYPEGLGDGHVSVLQTAKPEYQWQTTGYVRPETTDLVIYELLIRDFLAGHSYKLLIDTLSYLDNLGINAIELMPVNEFDGNESWGYNPSFYFAPDKYYGTEYKLKEFIDSCHARGIAVILDVVLNHATGSSPMAKLYWDAVNNRTAADNPWFNVLPKHDFNVFHDFNHDSELTRYHAMRVMSHWIEEYRVDGYRFDLSKGFTQTNTLGNVGLWGAYDASRVALWKMYADHMWSIDPGFYVILEHFADNTEEKELAEYGMMLWSNLNHSFSEISMGYTGSITWGSYKTRGWSVPHNVVYMESHDEERMQYRNENFGSSSGSYNIKELATGLDRLILSATFLYSIPGPKMLWQFGELGYDHSIDLNGRTGSKPIRWDFYNIAERKRVYKAFSALIKLKREEPAFESSDFSIIEEGKKKRIEINDPTMDVRVLGNFDVSSGFLSAEFSRTGKWYEFFSGDSIDVINTGELLTLQPGEYRLYTTKRLAKPDLAVGIDDLPGYTYDNSWFTLFPNPVSDLMNINITGNEGNVPELLEIIAADGRVVLSRRNPGTAPVDLSQLDSGYYLVRLLSGKKAGMKRIVKY